MTWAGRHLRLQVRVASALVILLANGCASSDPPRLPAQTTGPTTQQPVAPYTGFPDSVAAIGHSAMTGEGTEPGQPEVKANSWATGTNPQVNSIYQRILRAHPRIEGHAVNLGRGGADVRSLAEQAQRLILERPQPQLVLIATLDADISCPADKSDFDTYEQDLGAVLHDLSVKMPASRFFITTQISTPSHDAEVFSQGERASVGGTGPCAFLDTQGRIVPEELEQLEGAIAGYKSAATAACAQTARCNTDQSGRGWRIRRADYSDDLNHLNLNGQGRWADHIWGLLEEAKLVPKQ